MHMSPMIFLLLVALPSLVTSILLHSCSPTPILVFNGIRWQDEGSQVYDQLNGTVLVNILLDRELFDYCDLSQYNPDGIGPLLKRHGLNPGQKFVLLFNTYNQNCMDDAAVPRADVFKLGWLQTLYIYLQETGAEAIIDASRLTDPFSPYLKIADDLDTQRKMIQQVPARIPFFTARLSSANELASKVNEKVASFSRCYIQSLTPDYNQARQVMDNTNTFRLIMLSQILVNVALGGRVLETMKRILLNIQISSKHKAVQFMTLTPQFIVAVMRIIVSIDPWGVYGIFNYFVARLTMSLQAVIVFVCSVFMYIQWVDTIHQVDRTLDMKKRVMWLHNKRRLSAALLVALSLIVLDVTLSWFGHYQSLTVLEYIQPLMYMALNLCGSVYTIYAINKGKRTIEMLEATYGGTIPPADTGISNNVTNANKEHERATTKATKVDSSTVAESHTTSPPRLITSTSKVAPDSQSLVKSHPKSISPAGEGRSKSGASVKHSMQEVKRKIKKVSVSLTLSCYLVIVRVITTGLIGSPVFTSGIGPWSVITASNQIVEAVLSYYVIKVVNDMISS